MTVGAGGELLARMYWSSIFQALSSHPPLPCGLRVPVTHSGNTATVPLLLTASIHTHMPIHTPAHTAQSATDKNTHTGAIVIKVLYHVSIQPPVVVSGAASSPRFQNVLKEKLNWTPFLFFFIYLFILLENSFFQLITRIISCEH